MEVKLTKVTNGFILQITKFDFTSNLPDQTIYIFKTMDEVLAQIKAI